MFSTFIKLSFVIKIFILSIFEWPVNTGFTVPINHNEANISPVIDVVILRINTIEQTLAF